MMALFIVAGTSNAHDANFKCKVDGCKHDKVDQKSALVY